MTVNVKLADPAENGDTLGQGQMRALAETLSEVNVVLTHYVVENEENCQPVQVRGDPVHNVVDVFLPRSAGVSGIAQSAAKIDTPFSSLKVNTCVRTKEPVS